MERTGTQLRLAATDLARHLACRHLTVLDRAQALGESTAVFRPRPEAEVLAERGRRHEQDYLRHLVGLGRKVTILEGGGDGAGAGERLRAAMAAGADVIAQAVLGHGRWVGRADVLVRVERPSDLGPWSYEVQDTKLARETRGGTILQLCLYSDLLAELQGTAPEAMHVVTPGTGFVPESYRVADYQAYYRQVRRRLEAAVDAAPDAAMAPYPDPVVHCDVCGWWSACDRRRRADDHLSLVAGLSRLQARELAEREVATLAGLAALPLPLPWTPRRGAREGYVRVREQARIQREGRERDAVLHELLERSPACGLASLPAPSAGDVFLDLEGDSYVDSGGREYLFGYATREGPGVPGYACRWAIDGAGEKAALEWLIDAVRDREQRYPDFHVYHFGVYEPGALKRLMGRHATRESEIDDLLRAGRFVDLHAVTRQTLRASVERYSLKELEAVFGYRRECPLEEARPALRTAEHALELDDPGLLVAGVRETIEAYNRDDCLSAAALRDWLEERRAERIAAGEEIPRPQPPKYEVKEALRERERRARALAAGLMAGVPDHPEERSSAQRAQALLANLLEWHRREEKAPWWEYFRLRGLTEEDLRDERAGLGGLSFEARVGGTDKCPIDRYSFSRQETGIRKGDVVHAGEVELGKVVAIDPVEGRIEIHKRARAAELHPAGVFEHQAYPAPQQENSLLRLGEWILENGIDAPGPHRAARDLLLGLPPRIAETVRGTHGQGGRLRAADESPVAAARRLGLGLDSGVLAIQGPPGSGKTFTGAQMICDLAQRGLRVGVTAVSHKVVRNLIEAALREARRRGQTLRCAHKVATLATEPPADIAEMTANEEVIAALRSGDFDVAGGTAWLWSRAEFLESVDVLFVDEAGQMWLADVLALAQGARSLVLLGDPQQLEQPQQGAHPEGAIVTALEHVLQGRKTISEERGLFLEETWRLHPELCLFTSEMFYEDRLFSRAGLERQELVDAGPFADAGLWFVPVTHQGNTSSAREEVEAVAELIDTLTAPEAAWIHPEEGRRPLQLADILVVAPYNAQVADLTERLPRGARVGTVDRFQGQEAAVVIFSMTASSPEDAPRGMEFLYSPSRLNVATSRARCACILVGSPRLFEPECQTPRQMRLANAFCRFFERAREVPLEQVRAALGARA